LDKGSIQALAHHYYYYWLYHRIHNFTPSNFACGKMCSRKQTQKRPSETFESIFIVATYNELGFPDELTLPYCLYQGFCGNSHINLTTRPQRKKQMIEQKYQKLNVLIRIFLNPEPRVGEHHVIVVVAHRLVQRCFRKCADDNERIRMDGGRG
jgi:hypothetical protein